MTALPMAVRRTGGVRGVAVHIAVLGGLVLLVLFITIRMPSPSLVYTAAVATVAATAAWMFVSENYALTLGVLLLYLGLLDGFVKLSTGSSVATLGRDVLLFAIVFGALARFTLRKKQV